MEQTALRPKPMPGRMSAAGPSRRPHADRRRGRRLRTTVFSVLVASVLVLAGVGLGAVGVAAIGMNRLADLKQQALGHPKADAPGVPREPGADGAPHRSTQPPRQEEQSGKGDAGAAGGVARVTLGVEAADAPGGDGALLFGVHVSGPGHAAGLVRGDVLLTFGEVRVTSAAELAAAVRDARPGGQVTLTVRHQNGLRQSLSVVPGVVT